MTSLGRAAFALALLGLLAPLAACTVNPATGQQSFTGFMSEGEELRIGAQEHPKILREFGGAYDDPALADYVRQVGESLARVSETPNLRYTFTVLNDDKVNAFALPGGYVYITRGLLALADNEAEMAGVLAHEIGHVVARHTAQRYSQAMAANIGLTVLGVLGQAAGVPGAVGDLAQFGAAAALQSYSREQEIEADMLGVRYMSRIGYGSGAMNSFFRKMEAHDQLQAALEGRPAGEERYNIMSTHPRTSQRIEQAIALARVNAIANPRYERDAFLARIDGMIFGDDPRQGIRRGREFIHPGLRFRFVVPPDFALFNSPRPIVARGPQQSVIVFDMETEAKARAAGQLTRYLARDWGARLALRDVESIAINGLDGATGWSRAQTRTGVMDVRLVAIRADASRIYRMVFVTPPRLTESLRAELQRTTYSFRLLSPAEAAQVKPLRIALVAAKAGDTAESLSARMPFASHRLEWFEALNGLVRGQPLVPGVTFKTVAD
ncbi:MAG: M48 family metalloprotease [Rhodospirillales bacterium]|nr:M48 family metalloprotease [Rhodospirillales bacterium]